MIDVYNWGRYMGDALRFNRPSSYMVYGVRGSGKSSLLESIAEEYLANNCHVLDLFGSRDGEGLAWLRSPWIDEKKILLLHGDNTDVSSCWDSKNVSRYNLDDIDKYDLVISSSPLYDSIDTEYSQINKVLDLCYQRFEWKKPSYIVIREAANLLYSRMKISSDQSMAKTQMIYFIREARHTGWALGIDTLKFTSIDIDIRITIDYMFIKKPGIAGLPTDLSFLYKTYDPLSLQRMPNKNFLLITNVGSYGVGKFDYPKWHKEEGEAICKKLDIECEHGEPLVETKDSYRVGDFDHVEICNLRIDGMTYEAIAQTKDMAPSTTYSQVSKHNKDIEKLGSCTRCTRAKADIAITFIE